MKIWVLQKVKKIKSCLNPKIKCGKKFFQQKFLHATTLSSPISDTMKLCNINICF